MLAVRNRRVEFFKVPEDISQPKSNAGIIFRTPGSMTNEGTHKDVCLVARNRQGSRDLCPEFPILSK